MPTLTTPHALIESKTLVPRVRSSAVRRDALLQQLARSRDRRVVSVSAPAGYGKTTLLAEWAEDERRPVGWVCLDERDNDPVLLLHYVLAALGRAGLTVGAPPPARARRPLRWARLLPDVEAALRSGALPPVLILDDVHELSGDALDVVEALAAIVPEGGQLVVSGRLELTGIVAHLRAAGDVLEVQAADLRLTEPETAALLDAAGAAVDAAAVTELHRRSEGWAAGIYLAALALDATGTLPTAAASVDRFVEDYFRAEHLARIPDDERSFLTRSAVLERMSPELCDAVLERDDSRRMLDAIERSNLFLVALDHERRWFRYHELFRRALLLELERSDPGAPRALAGRAADWCDAQHLPEDAMAYAIAASDTDRMARLVLVFALPLYRAGRQATAMSWLEHFDDVQSLRRFPAVAAVGALGHALVGKPFPAERWIDAGWAADPGGPLPDGSASARPWLATAEAMLCRHGPERMAEDAGAALAGLGSFSPLRAPATWLRAAALALGGDAGADDALAEATRVADETGGVLVQVAARAQRALLALETDDPARARGLVDEAQRCIEHARFDEYMPLALLLAADARVAIREGAAARAAARLTDVQRLRPELTEAIPFVSVQVLVAAGQAYLEIGDSTGAASLLADAREVLRRRPSLGRLVEDVAELGRRVAAAAHGDEATSSSGLTPAELRLLPLLTTHLTFAEIGQRLFVSRNTVKTQAISIYRKLGASSRSEAVRLAEEAGLVDEPFGEHARIIPSG